MYGDDIWWFSFYDMDSSLGLDNTGYNKFDSNIEPNQPGVYNCSTSRMWVKLNEYSQDDLFNTFKTIREGKYTYENICKYLIEKQIDVIPQLLYNKDMYQKYISQGRQYLHMLHGNNKDHLKRWLYNRFQYVDSLFLQHNSPYTKQSITIRSCAPANAVPKTDSEGNIISPYTARFEIQTYVPQYVTVCWRKNTFETKRVNWNETVVFENDMVNSQDNELIVYCANNLKHLGDISGLNPTSIDIGNATRLIEFTCEDSDKLVKADLSKNSFLKKASFRGCSVMGTASGGSNVLDVTGCTNLKELDIRGTQITSLLTNTEGGNLEKILYPEAIQNVVLSNQINLEVIGLPYGFQNEIDYSNYTFINGDNAKYKDGVYTRISPNTQYKFGFSDCTLLYKPSPENVDTRCYGNVVIGWYDSDFKKISEIGKTQYIENRKDCDWFILTDTAPNNAYYMRIEKFTFNHQHDIGNYRKDVNEMLMYFIFVETNLWDISLHCKNLSSVTILNCENVKALSYPYTEGEPVNFNSLKYVQNLTLSNSIPSLTELSFDGFSKLRNINVYTMPQITSIKFTDLLPATETSTFKTLTLANIPQVDTVSFNVTSDNYKIAFADGAKVDLGNLTSCHTIESNYSIKGLNTLILPITVRNLRFTTEYGDGINDITNIWSHNCNHEGDGFTGLDFADMSIDYIDMTGLSKVTSGINFNLSPTNHNPNLNTGRDGSAEKPYFRPTGTLNLDNYTGDMTNMLKGIDLSLLEVEINANKTQTDLSYLFYGAIGTNTDVVDRILGRFPNSTVWDYMFATSDRNTDYDLPLRLTSVIGTFKNTAISEYLENWNKTYDNGITATDCYVGTSGDLDEIPTAWGGYGFNKDVTSIIVVEIPSDNYEMKVCDYPQYNLLSSKTINWGDGTVTTGTNIHTYATAGTYTIKSHTAFGYYEPSSSIRNCLIEVKQIALSGIDKNFDSAFSNCTKLTKVTAYNLAPKNCGSMFRNCSSLTEIVGLDTWDMSKCTNVDYMFADTRLTDYSFFYDWTLSPTLTSVEGLFQYSNIEIVEMGRFQQSIVNFRHLSSFCPNLTTIDFTGINPNTINMAFAFGICQNVTSIIGANTMSFNDGVWLEAMFNETLKNIEEIDLSGITCKVRSVPLFNGDNGILKTIKIAWDWTDVTGQPNYFLPSTNTVENVEWGRNIKFDINNYFYVSSQTKLTVASLVNLFNALYDFASEGNADTHTCVIGSTNLAKLTDEQKMIAVNKGWFLSGYNTVRIPAGMDISGFTTDNNVTKVYVQLTSENATSRIAELCAKYPNITEVYLFENGTITEAVNIFTGVDTNIKAQITKVVFMEGYFNNVTLDMREYGNLDELPVVWGGFGFSKDVTSIAVVEIPSNNYTLKVCSDGGGAVVGQGNIDWGDGTFGNITSDQNHTYTTAGTYTIKGHFTFGYWGNTMQEELIEVKQVALNARDKKFNLAFANCGKLTKVTAYNLAPIDCSGMFRNCSSLTEIVGMDTWDMSNCSSYDSFIRDCTSIAYDTLLKLSRVLDFSKANNVENMFVGVTFDNAIPLQQLNISSLTSLRYMLTGVIVNGDLDLTMWDVSKVTNLYYFLNSANIQGAVNLGGWNTSNVTNFSRFLHWAYNVTSVNLSGWDFSKNSNDDQFLFIGCPAPDWDFTGASGIKKDLAINNPTNWSVNSLVGLFNALYDFAGNGDANTHILTLGSGHLAKLTDEQIAIATNKGWTLQ